MTTLDKSFHRGTYRVISLYWKSEEKLFAWCSLVALTVLSLMAVVVALAINEWYKHFYNAIHGLDAGSFYQLVVLFLVFILFSALRSVAITCWVDIFALRWRRWLTNYYLEIWVVESVRPDDIERYVDNPDQRLAEDINKFTFDTVDLACGLLYTISSVVSFTIVLISISGHAELLGVNVPAYMFWIAFIYASAGTYISQKIGFTLVGLNNNKQCSEADLRYLLISFRNDSYDQADGVCRIAKRNLISQKLDVSLENMRRIIRVKMRLSLFTESYSRMSLIISSLLAAPKYFSGEIMFGEVMQINSAFGNLCGNLSWFINSYDRLADWRATADRIVSFNGALGENLDSSRGLAGSR
ncbi:SbmA/BacA-like family transporter [Pseudomonas sp. BP8]|uniref:SbmA/BacA-like family transporter n=1 Tax=Pseudomonas sp. BP8 TaxID=2817864 RepID=UPI001AE1CB0C|nr:SbmA/BacA-like family transporter [Pseudomonas sp. BP8]MBP2262203.1 putative ATP-binding cassette transporter [Pseudomonas sp. BP8]HDS1733130.1 hypothetical protein [Pseudomonas putida]